MNKSAGFHHNVYVIQLDAAVAKHRFILRLNPNRDPLKPCAYVGMIGIPAEHRFENHKNGYKSAWVVRKYDGPSRYHSGRFHRGQASLERHR